MKTAERIQEAIKHKPLICISALCVVFLILGVYIGRFQDRKKAYTQTNQVVNSIKPVRENNFNYEYIFPLLTYDFGEANQYFRNDELSRKVSDYINSQVSSKNIESAAFYVRNFSDNHWAGSNETVQYHPGSMLKVLIMMAYFREAQLDPTILDQQFTYDTRTDQETHNINFSLGTSLKVGEKYSVTELIKQMIADSDNGAQSLLINHVDREVLNSAYNDLNIKNPDITEGDYTISPRQYSAFLRILYNSTYLTETYSEQALSIMAKSTYNEGLNAGVPDNVKVSNKYGERIEGTPDHITAIELHDCGIVYATNHPYSICVMTRGQNLEHLTQTIQKISSLVYQEFVTQ